MVVKNGMEIGCLLEEEFQKVNLYVLRETANCYLFKTTENFGATRSITFPARGSFATQVNKIYLVNRVISVFCQ